jgi:hypothetical protein
MAHPIVFVKTTTEVGCPILGAHLACQTKFFPSDTGQAPYSNSIHPKNVKIPIRCYKAYMPHKIRNSNRVKPKHMQQTPSGPFPFGNDCSTWNNLASTVLRAKQGGKRTQRIL